MIPFLKPILPSVERYQKHINKMHEDNRFSNGGQFVCQLEKNLQEYLQTSREIVLVSNATLGLILAFKGLEVAGKVLVPSFTFAATIAALEWCGLDYEYVDIDDTWCVDPVKVEARLATGCYSAIMPVHAQGNPCNITTLEQLAQKYNVKLIFDAASGIGASYNNRRIGNFGDIEVFSLHATKCLPAGEGGFISVRDPSVAARIRKLLNFGFDESRTAILNGLNAKMPEILAAIGIEALQDLKQHMRNRHKYADIYRQELSDLVKFQRVQDNSEHGLQILSCLIDTDVGHVVEKMASKDIQIRRYYAPPTHQHIAYRRIVDLPVTEKVSARIVSLPLYSIMEEHTIHTVCKALKEVCNDTAV